MRLEYQRKHKSNKCHKRETQQEKKKKRATTLLVAIIFAFILCYAPGAFYPLHRILFKKSQDLQNEDVLRGISELLWYINSPVNFCIHLVQLPGFYSHLKNILSLEINLHLVHKRNGTGKEATTKKELCRKCESLPNLLPIQSITDNNRSRRSSV